MKLFLQPNYTGTTDRAEGGIRRVVEAMCRYLPEFGIEVTDDIRRADITNGHGVMRPLKPHTPFVSSCHGMYWHGYNWANWAHQVNAEVTEALISANAITAPSQWVANALTRGIMRRPHVVYHGVDADEWEHSEDNGGYVLWNKARVDPVSNPDDLNRLVNAMPNTKFVSTFGIPRANLSLIGAVPLPEMKRVIQRAGVYLCTARETFGIGTLEALAAGVPVVGWGYGGQSEIIIHGETGYLVEYGNYAELADYIYLALDQRKRLSYNAISDAKERWQWKPRIAQYAQIFHDVYKEYHAPKPTVSVIVPCHNLAEFLPACLDSVIRQPFKTWECLIVDDCSTDKSAEIAKEYVSRDSRFRYIHTASNLKLSRVLSLGAYASHGKYIVNLDADNMFTEDALSDCVRELENDPALHIAYGSLDKINYDGTGRMRNCDGNGKCWPVAFNWRGQIAHLNQIHSSALMRREVAIELGGWRERQWRAEDAEFWTRATSYGFRAKRITENPTLIYRVRADSKGALEHRNDGGDGDWEMFFPFATAHDGRDGQNAIREKRPIARIETVPFSAQGTLGIEKRHWPVFHHQAPVVSVIIPCSLDHRRYIIDALDSLLGQDVIDWEVIVVNTASDPLDCILGAPYARIINCQGEVGAARNMGAKVARGKLLYFLDADDYLLPGALRSLLSQYATGETAYVFSDYVELWESWQSGLEYCGDKVKGLDLNQFKEYFRKHANEMQTGKHGERYSFFNAEANTFGRRIYLDEYKQGNPKQAITNILIAKGDFESVSGFDETLPSREDWDFLCKLAVNGKCGKRVPVAGFAYRLATGTRRNVGMEKQTELSQIIKSRYDRYYSGDGVTMSECCGGNDEAILAAKRAVAFSYGDAEGVAKYAPRPETLNAITSGITPLMVRLEFTGSQAGPIPFMGGNGRQYRGANSVKYKYIDAHPDDVERLVNTGQWQRVEVISPIPEPPIVETLVSAEMSNSTPVTELETQAPILEPVKVSPKQEEKKPVTLKAKRKWRQ